VCLALKPFISVNRWVLGGVIPPEYRLLNALSIFPRLFTDKVRAQQRSLFTFYRNDIAAGQSAKENRVHSAVMADERIEIEADWRAGHVGHRHDVHNGLISSRRIQNVLGGSQGTHLSLLLLS